jgi:hypothetical protein
MPITIAPKWDELTSTETLLKAGGGATLRYFAYSDVNEAQADIRNAVKANSPDIWDIWLRESITVEGRISDAPGNYIWSVAVQYLNPFTEQQNNVRRLPNAESGPNSEPVFEIRTGGGATVQQTKSLMLVDESATDFSYFFSLKPYKNIMGFKNADANSKNTFDYDGVPVQYGTTEVVVHLWRSNLTIDSGWLLKVIDAASDNKVNSDQFGIFPARTLRFNNFQAVQSIGGVDAGWRITLNFIYSRNKSKDLINVETGFLFPLTKDPGGHEILDFLSLPGNDPDTTVVLSKPVRLAVHQVYPETPYAQLFAP